MKSMHITKNSECLMQEFMSLRQIGYLVVLLGNESKASKKRVDAHTWSIVGNIVPHLDSHP